MFRLSNWFSGKICINIWIQNMSTFMRRNIRMPLRAMRVLSNINIFLISYERCKKTSTTHHARTKWKRMAEALDQLPIIEWITWPPHWKHLKFDIKDSHETNFHMRMLSHVHQNFFKNPFMAHFGPLCMYIHAHADFDIRMFHMLPHSHGQP